MATLDFFKAQFPEFNNVSAILVGSMLTAAKLEIDTSVWGAFGPDAGPLTKADQGQMYLTAHKLACSPAGQNARTVFQKGTGYERTTYGLEFRNLQKSVVSGFRVA